MHRAASRLQWLALILLSALSLGKFDSVAYAKAQPSVQVRKDEIQVLFVSDIHFEPFLDPEKAEKLAAAPVSEWHTILAAPASDDIAARWARLEQVCPVRGHDTSYLLYRSSLIAIREHAKAAKFAVVSGDLIAHSFSCKFQALFPKASPQDYRAFVVKTIAYVLAELRGALPGVPVYAALGNNDSDCGDYQLDAGSPFLSELAPVFVGRAQDGLQTQDVHAFDARGDYSVALPAPVKNGRLLVLDDLFASARYRTCSGKVDASPAARQIAWLKQHLDTARAQNENVWVMAHIPPGVDPYSTARRWMTLCSGGNPQTFLGSNALSDTLAAYGDVIRLAIFAHTHMDELRVLEPEKGSAADMPVAVKIVASISPVDGNNSSFTVGTVDVNHAVLADYRVIAASNQTGVDTSWSEEYDFAATYHKPGFTAAAVNDLITGFRSDPMAQSVASQSYLQNYMTGKDMRSLALFWAPYTCSLTNSTADAYRLCVCSNAP